jgi:hypothetical protein
MAVDAKLELPVLHFEEHKCHGSTKKWHSPSPQGKNEEEAADREKPLKPFEEDANEGTMDVDQPEFQKQWSSVSHNIDLTVSNAEDQPMLSQ